MDQVDRIVAVLCGYLSILDYCWSSTLADGESVDYNSVLASVLGGTQWELCDK